MNMDAVLFNVPPGFRFHPTDEELVDYYLRKKVESKRIDLDIIKAVDLYKIEPWDLQGKCKIGKEEQSDWYFFSHKDKKYPTGTRTNRATTAGFWKATGRDKPIYSSKSSLILIGMRKTLVFYKGRAPYGQKSDWIMHEYRLETIENAPPQEEGWVVCRVFKKKVAAMRIVNEQDTSNCWYTEPQIEMPSYQQHYHNLIACKPELEMSYHLPHDSFLHLPQLESPKFPAYSSNSSQEHPNKHLHQVITASINPEKADDLSALEQVADWRILDKFVVNQLSQYGDICKDFNCLDSTTEHVQVSDKYEAAGDYASTSSSFELWK